MWWTASYSVNADGRESKMYVVTGDEMHQIDRYTMDSIGLKEEILMENAGQAFCRQLIPQLKKEDRIVVLIGTGNNGGDGFVIGRILKEAGCNVDVWVIPPEEKIRGTALVHKGIYERSGYKWISYQELISKESLEFLFGKYSMLIDALLGTGIKGEPRDPYNQLIASINQAKGKVISVDIPSGVSGEEGIRSNLSVKACETFTFQAPKLSAFLYPAALNYGELHVLDIGIPKRAFTELQIKRKLIVEEQVKRTLVKRMPDAHKGSVGKALIIGGSLQMTGAPVLTTEACLRSGAGLTTLAVPDVIHPIVSQKTTEATFLPLVSDGEGIKASSLSEVKSMNKYDAIAVGPGLGRNQDYPLHDIFIDYEGALVVDADGLYHLSKELDMWKKLPRQGGVTVITPHSGEMARLAGTTVRDVEKNRFQLSKDFAELYGMYVVLKGPYTIVTSPAGDQWVNTSGNPSLAKGGSGDVLTGILLAFLLQNKDALTAIYNAVYIHGKTADMLVETHDMVSVTATDLVKWLPKVFKTLRYRT